MSTDLELICSKNKITAINIQTSEEIHHDDQVLQQEESSSSNDEEKCRTPTSAEHKIPPVLCCPPAPQKPRRRVSCKRKLSELELFEIVNRDEMDAYFRTELELFQRDRRRPPYTYDHESSSFHFMGIPSLNKAKRDE
ncbi:hypothetical protein SLE2022_110760 [Rubroshorea leprosula]